MPDDTQSAAVAAGKKRERSPDYPALDLATALERAVHLYEKQGMNWAPVELVYKHWGHSKNSSTAMMESAALGKYGLLEDRGAGEKREFKLTEGFLLYHRDKRPNSEDRKRFLQAVALKPVINAELWSRFKDDWPTDEHLDYYLTAQRPQRFTTDGAKRFLRQFKATIEFAGLRGGGIIGQSDEGGATEQEAPEPDANRDRPGAGGEKPKPNPGVAQFRSAGMIEQPIPVSPDRYVILTAPKPMSEQEWEMLQRTLEMWKPLWVGAVPPKTQDDE